VTVVERIKRLFTTPKPSEIVTDEAAIGKKTLELTIKRAEKTTERVMRRSANDIRRAEPFIEATREVAEQLQRRGTR
jgi:hypothetical protein